MSGLSAAGAAHLKSVKYKSTTIKTSWPARTATTYKDRWIGAYFIGLTIQGNLAVQIILRRTIGSIGNPPIYQVTWVGSQRYPCRAKR
jgi:hypothetical protein